MAVDVRPIIRTSPSACPRIKYSSRSDTSGSCPTGDHCWSATQTDFWHPTATSCLSGVLHYFTRNRSGRRDASVAVAAIELHVPTQPAAPNRTPRTGSRPAGLPSPRTAPPPPGSPRGGDGPRRTRPRPGRAPGDRSTDRGRIPRPRSLGGTLLGSSGRLTAAPARRRQLTPLLLITRSDYDRSDRTMATIVATAATAAAKKVAATTKPPTSMPTAESGGSSVRGRRHACGC